MLAQQAFMPLRHHSLPPKHHSCCLIICLLSGMTLHFFSVLAHTPNALSQLQLSPKDTAIATVDFTNPSLCCSRLWMSWRSSRILRALFFQSCVLGRSLLSSRNSCFCLDSLGTSYTSFCFSWERTPTFVGEAWTMILSTLLALQLPMSARYSHGVCLSPPPATGLCSRQLLLCVGLCPGRSPADWLESGP